MNERVVNQKKAIDRKCPRCGEMLNFIYRTDQHGKNARCELRRTAARRVAPDDVEIPKLKKVSKYESKVVGRLYVHVETYECRWCHGHWSEAQAIPHEFAYEELPIDYYLREVDWGKAREDFEAAKRGEYKRPRFLCEVEPQPVQQEITF